MTLSGALKGDTSLVSQLVKNTSANAEDPRDTDLIPVSGRSPGERKGNPLQYIYIFFSLQYSCLKNSMDREAWWATVHGITKNRT